MCICDKNWAHFVFHKMFASEQQKIYRKMAKFAISITLRAPYSAPPSRFWANVYVTAQAERTFETMSKSVFSLSIGLTIPKILCQMSDHSVRNGPKMVTINARNCAIDFYCICKSNL
jgi:hypothetical protein